MRLKDMGKKGGFNESCGKHRRRGFGCDEAAMGRRDVQASRVAAVDQGAGHDGIRHFGRRARGHRDSGDHGLPTALAGAVERDSRRHKRPVALIASVSGQSTVEFAVVMSTFLAVTAALAALWRAIGDGLLTSHALAVASHHIQMVAPTTLVDIFLY